MLVYRISQTKYAGSLVASGIAGRWNTAGEPMIYTGGSISLSCLEVLAHRNGASLSFDKFSMAMLLIPDDLQILEIKVPELQSLNAEWFHVEHCPITQKIGNQWINNMKTAVLKVPSAIIDKEYNYLLNTWHIDFNQIKIVDITPFNFDNRLKLNVNI